MKYVYSFIFILILLLAVGCQSSHSNNGTGSASSQSFEEAVSTTMLNNEFQIIEKVKKEDFAFALAVSPDESQSKLSILHFSKGEKGWHYQGASGFESDKAPVSYVGSTWVKGTYTLNEDNQYVTVHAGEITNLEVAKVTLTIHEKEVDASIIRENDPSFWYYAIDNSRGNDEVESISAFAENGKLLYQHQRE